MKIFILAIDGLEYNLVKRWRLKGLQQRVFGHIDVADLKTLLTPVIWASFITGQPPAVHGITSWWSVSSNSKLNTIFHWLRYKVPIFKKMSQWRLRKILKFFGLDVRPPQSSDLYHKGLTTIFDYGKNPVVVDVPSYNESADTRARYSKAMEGGISEYEKELWEVHNERVGRIVDGLNTQWDLFMAWIDIADQMGHLYMDINRLKMLKTYIHLENLVSRIKEKIMGDILFMIVSDHGMESSPDEVPIHSNRSFYSFNVNIEWRPNSILDYYSFIRDFIKSNNNEGL